MNPILDGLIGIHFSERIIIDGNLCIRSFTQGARSFAFDASAVAEGRDIRDGFPEFVGAEKTLGDIMKGQRVDWSLFGIDRTDQRTVPCFVGIMARAWKASSGIPWSLEVSLADVTQTMMHLRSLTQAVNSATLLLDALAVSRSYVENILNSMPDALFVTSCSGIIQTVNHVAARMLGCTDSEIIGKPLSRFLHNDQLSKIIDSQGVGKVSAPIENFEATYLGKDARETPVVFSCSMIHTDAAQGIIFVGRDLTAIRLAEATINKLQKENLYLQEELNSEHNFEEMIGSSPAMQDVFKKIQQVSATDSTVLLLGETGTGKELIARAIHNTSHRKQNVLVKVNCAALPSGLVESELFGHEKGAFTGATGRKIGRFELAHEGTILLDEISELPLDTQAKLLRVLQEREFERVGGTQPIRVDVRIIASTNRDLVESMSMGAFREDLFYRLNVFPIQIPPLRMRDEDISLLVYYFVDKFARRLQKRITGVSQQCMNNIKRYRWPGNVRELASVIERAIIVCQGDTLDEVDISIAGSVPQGEGTNLDDVQRQHILEVLEQCGGVIEGTSGAASKLGMNPGTLRSRLKKLGIIKKGNRFARQSRP